MRNQNELKGLKWGQLTEEEQAFLLDLKYVDSGMYLPEDGENVIIDFQDTILSVSGVYKTNGEAYWVEIADESVLYNSAE